jgi:chromosome segregation ATPase
VLYLAEVQKQKGGLLGSGSKTELKLLACQRTDQSWNPVPEEVINAEDASKLNDGALVLVEMTPNRQLQRIQEAGRPLVNILQNFSRQLEKFKLKEDEIDQWKESLTFQAQELNRREMDMETRWEQLQQIEEELQNLETQQQQVKTSRAEIEQLQQELERNHQELEGAWEHLRGEQRRIEEYQANCQQGKVLDEEQSRVISELLDSELLDRLSTRVAPTEILKEHLQLSFELVEKQQANLNPHWEKLEQQKTLATQQQEEVNRLVHSLSDRQNAYQQAQNSLEEQTSQLKVHTAVLTSKKEYIQILNEQLRHEQDLYQDIHSLAANSSDAVISQQLNVEALEKMPQEELQKLIQDLQTKFEIDSTFVQDQELELKYKQDTIEELQKKINQASDQDRINLETELTEEKDLYQMLNETLVGQRRNLLERQKLIKEHRNILRRRQGNTLADVQENQKIDFSQILLQIENQRQQHSQELQKLERDIEQMRAAIELAQGTINTQSQELENKRQELKTIEENLQNLRTATAECWSRVNLYQEALQPIQDCLDGLREKLQVMVEDLAQIQETGNYQLQTISQMRHTLLSLISQPELIAS